MDSEKLTGLTHVQSLGFTSYIVGEFYIKLHLKLGEKMVKVTFEDLSEKNDYSRMLVTVDNKLEMIITDGAHLNVVVHKLVGRGVEGITTSWLYAHGFTDVTTKLARYQLFIERGDYEVEEN